MSTKYMPPRNVHRKLHLFTFKSRLVMNHALRIMVLVILITLAVYILYIFIYTVYSDGGEDAIVMLDYFEKNLLEVVKQVIKRGERWMVLAKEQVNSWFRLRG
ncbi:hypothetical protein SY83_03590 [Paenibacillus swuensis]|uniref:Uncharacterized protein n=1 Tax=Paenibacillus swuensis TaxID=1178515 RepID=A0A172TFI2_9BACL|nr:hypothetical protein SY83_03590 [Paenibacillus swuensis]